MNRENTPPLLYVIAVLVVINLVVTGWIATKILSPSSAVSESTPVEKLPSYLTKEAKRQIYSDFRQAFNSRNLDTFWDFFSDVARAYMNKADLKKNYDKMLDYFGGVEEGTFSHYEYAGSQGNLKAFDLYYIAKFPETSKFGEQGELVITIEDDGREYVISGANLRSISQ